MSIKFGTSGFRAIIGDEFTKENVLKVAQSVCNIILEDNLKKETFIGYDNRFMSENFAEWAAEVFAGNGIKVRLISQSCITPVVMFAALKYDLDYTMMITASHNPYIYNGIKIFVSEGKDAGVQDVFRIEKICQVLTEVKRIPFHEGLKNEKIVKLSEEDNYLNSLLKLVEIKKSPKVAFDAMYGSSITLLKKLIERLKINDSILLNGERNAFFNFSMPSPNLETTKVLHDLVISKKYDLGLALDGDGDRIGVIDRNGNYIDNNDVMACLYYYRIKFKGEKGDIVKTKSTSNLLDALAKKFGYACHAVPVGFKYISPKLVETKAVLGGESSGGLAIQNHILGKDSLLTTVLLLEMISNMKKPLDEIVKEVRLFANFKGIFVEKQFEFSPEIKDEIIDKTINKKLMPKFFKKIVNVDYEDGVKVDFIDGSWSYVRFSGTEPLIRVYGEFETIEENEKACLLWLKFLGIK